MKPFTSIRMLTVCLALQAISILAIAQPGEAPAEHQADAQETTKATKTRSNIQNNKEVTSAAPPKAAAPQSPEGQSAVIKTKTKSNQSND